MIRDVNLLDLFGKGIVKEGGHTVKVPMKKANGSPYSGKTYAIPLEYLYYNDQNGRIGVSLSEYESSGKKLDKVSNLEEYNEAIENMISDYDGTTRKEMEKLKRDIGIKGQEEPGYVLLDGRVIDGNRRFTACRLLDRDPHILEQQYFEAVILDDLSIQNYDDLKKIKSLELQIQFGKLGKVDYNPIDRAIDAYKTISINGIMSAKEYAEYSALSIREVNKRILEAELIVKFLEFSNAHPSNYVLAKEMELDGPIQEMIPQYRKFIKGHEQEKQILNSLFTKIIQIRAGKEDFKSDFRQIVKDVVGTKNQNAFTEEMEDATDTIVEILEESEPIKSRHELFSILHSSSEATQSLAEVKVVSNKFSEKAQNYKMQNELLVLANKAHSSVEAISLEKVQKLNKIEKNQLFSNLNKLKGIIEQILIEGE